MNLDYDAWVSSVVAPDDPVCRNAEYYRCYMEKKELASKFAPKASTVAEIGLRAGYSAHAFLSVLPEAKVYVGYDLFSGMYFDGWNGTLHADKILREFFPSVFVCLITANTQKLTTIGLKGIDLFHVDGDHSHAGTMHDMAMAWKTLSDGGLMIVDDYDHIPSAKTAVDQFLKENKNDISFYEHVPTYRGDVVIRKGNAVEITL